jgi:hypothetical protein
MQRRVRSDLLVMAVALPLKPTMYIHRKSFFYMVVAVLFACSFLLLSCSVLLHPKFKVLHTLYARHTSWCSGHLSAKGPLRHLT